MIKAYVICGLETSGNRMMVAIMCRSGCTKVLNKAMLGRGRKGHFPEAIPVPGETPFACHLHDEAARWIETIRSRGYTKDQMIGIMPVREPFAWLKARRSRREASKLPQETLLKRRIDVIHNNIHDFYTAGVRLEIVPYESVNEAMLKNWLPTIGLEYQGGPINVTPGAHPVIDASTNNHKYYRRPT